MIIDTSVLVAILLEEPEHRVFYEKIVDTYGSQVSTVSYVEAAMVLIGRKGESVTTRLERLLIELEVLVTPIRLEQAQLAVDAFRRYGKGRHPAALNFGDCFSYALAKSVGEPLLYKGTDFSRTDVDVA